MNYREALIRLVNDHMYEGREGLEWGWVEGCGLGSVDPELNTFLLTFKRCI